MRPETERLLRDPASELVFGLVAPVGTDLDTFEAALARELHRYGYTTNPVRLSSFLPVVAEDLGVVLKHVPEADRVRSHMDAGNRLRERSGAGEILALWAMARIHEDRPDETPERPRTAHILRSIKHPDEVQALRAVYGPGFFLIGVAASRHEKITNLETRGLSTSEAEALIERDAGEDDKFGQKTRDAFQLADVHIRQGSPDHQLERFIRLVFGAHHETPTKDEHAMFLAYASSARSGDLSRQVGAVLWRDNAGVLATGCNDVPAPGGGLYWAGPLDHRDHILGHDANERHKQQIAADVARRVKDALKDRKALLLDEEALAIVHGACLKTRLLDITEFGRAVHAEMDALLACTRAGISTEGATLFCTTFPCHNCAKHVVAAGIRRVVYIEPYEKSQARDLHGDAIQFDDHGDHFMRNVEDQTDAGKGGENSPSSSSAKVIFEPFVGIGPRRYLDLFSMKLSNGYPLKRKAEGKKAAWQVSRDGVVRVPMPHTTYAEREALLATLLRELLQEMP